MMKLAGKIGPFLGLSVLALSLSGCMARLTDFTALSTKSANIPGERGPRVRGEDLATIIFFFPTGKADIKNAVDRAIEKGGGDLLVDGVISQECWYIPLLFGQCGYVVEGTPVRLSGPISASAGAAPPTQSPAMGLK